MSHARPRVRDVEKAEERQPPQAHAGFGHFPPSNPSDSNGGMRVD